MWQAGGHVLNRQVTHLELSLVFGQLGEQLVQIPAAENNAKKRRSTLKPVLWIRICMGHIKLKGWIRIRNRITVISWIRIRIHFKVISWITIRINLQMTTKDG
jgi:hypothetical protein